MCTALSFCTEPTLHYEMRSMTFLGRSLYYDGIIGKNGAGDYHVRMVAVNNRPAVLRMSF